MEFHEAANIFPLDDDNIAALADDIREHGQQVEIELLDGKVLDGRRRWLACKMAGKKPLTKTVSIADPIAYVLSLNLHRRHLAPSQLAMVGARAREIYDRNAKERMKRKSGNSAVENLPQQNGKARDQVGKAIGVSGRSVDFATRVLNQGTPELIKAVDDGRMAVSTAALVASDPPEKQLEEINNPNRKRTYLAGQGNVGTRNVTQHKEPEEESPAGELRGVGVLRANEAINCLTRIPKNDALRKRGFQIVTDWIRKNR
jgi:hypothetical protein